MIMMTYSRLYLYEEFTCEIVSRQIEDLSRRAKEFVEKEG